MSSTSGPFARPIAEFIPETTGSEIVLLCEHASNYVPDEYNGLELGEADLARHIAWDIGAADVTRALAAKLGAAAILATYSRLVIDLNRPLGSSESIPSLSEETVIPGNRVATAEDKSLRESRLFRPFHKQVAAYLDSRDGRPTKLVTIHSFTPRYLGIDRPWHGGVLFGKSVAFANDVLARLRTDPALNVELNQPYVVSTESDFAIPVHGDGRGLDAVLIEIRNDLIDQPRGAIEWADRLCSALNPSSG